MTWTDAGNILGLLIGVVGFGLTLWQLHKTRNAAQAARAAAEDVRSHLQHFDAVSEIAGALATMEEIKRLYLNRAYLLIPDRCTIVRQRLVTLRESSVGLTDGQRALIQGAIVQFHELETKCVVSGTTQEAATAKQTARMNTVISEQLDNLSGVLANIKRLTGAMSHG